MSVVGMCICPLCQATSALPVLHKYPPTLKNPPSYS